MEKVINKYFPSSGAPTVAIYGRHGNMRKVMPVTDNTTGKKNPSNKEDHKKSTTTKKTSTAVSNPDDPHKKLITFFQSDERKVINGWLEENHGGFSIWVNQITNEVSFTNPHHPEKGLNHMNNNNNHHHHHAPKPTQLQRNFTYRVKAGPIPKGTAAHLYDEREVADLFRVLDATK